MGCRLYVAASEASCATAGVCGATDPRWSPILRWRSFVAASEASCATVGVCGATDPTALVDVGATADAVCGTTDPTALTVAGTATDACEAACRTTDPTALAAVGLLWRSVPPTLGSHYNAWRSVPPSWVHTTTPGGAFPHLGFTLQRHGAAYLHGAEFPHPGFTRTHRAPCHR